MQKMLCELRLTPLSYPDSIAIESRPIDLPDKPWIAGKIRSWDELKRDLAEKDHNLESAEESLSIGRAFITDARFHYYEDDH